MMGLIDSVVDSPIGVSGLRWACYSRPQRRSRVSAPANSPITSATLCSPVTQADCLPRPDGELVEVLAGGGGLELGAHRRRGGELILAAVPGLGERVAHHTSAVLRGPRLLHRDVVHVRVDRAVQVGGQDLRAPRR